MRVSVPVLREFKHIVNRKVAAPRLPSVGEPANKLCGLGADVPPYPYGPATSFKQSDRGLYGGKTLQFGHKISEYGNKHVRVFYPNVQKVSLWSEVLKKTLRLRVASSVLKTITNEGGLDAYLTKDTPQRVKQLGQTGWRLRYEVLARQAIQERTAPKFTEVDGVRVFGEAVVEGTASKITVGRTRLAKLCFEHSRDGSLRSHMRKYQNASFQELVDLCAERNVPVPVL